MAVDFGVYFAPRGGLLFSGGVGEQIVWNRCQERCSFVSCLPDAFLSEGGLLFTRWFTVYS